MTAPDVRTPGASRANAEDTREDNAQFTGQPSDRQTAQRAQFEHLRAALAQRGHELHATADGYTVRRWGLSKELNDLDEAEEFARAVGANV